MEKTIPDYNLRIFLLFFAVFIDLLGFGIVIPILPFYAEQLGADSVLYGALIAVYSAMQFVFAPIWGTISDRIGRRPVILLGLFGSVIGYGIFGLSLSLSVLFLSRMVSGIFTAATLTVANAYAADITPYEKRGSVFGNLTAAFGLGFALGPAIGGKLAEYSFFGLHGIATPGLFASLLSFINFVGAYFVLKESLPPDVRNNRENNGSLFVILGIGKLTKYPNALNYVLLFSVVTFGFSNFIAAFALYVPKVDPSIDPPRLGVLYTFTGLILFFSQYFMVKPLIQRFGEGLLVKIGSVSVLTGFLLIPLAPSYFWYFFVIVPLIIGISSLNPSFNSLLSKSVPVEKQGEALGINQGMASLMRTVGPSLAGLLMKIAYVIPFYFGAVIFIGIIYVVFTKVAYPPVSSEY